MYDSFKQWAKKPVQFNNGLALSFLITNIAVASLLFDKAFS